MKQRDGQNNLDQYKMPKALRKKREAPYRVGYTATTGNVTEGEPDLGKRADLEN